MPSRRSVLAVLAAAVLALVVAAPAMLAAGGLAVAGTVTRDGAPVAGAGVTIMVQGSDMVFQATTDANGAWSTSIGAAGGDILDIGASISTTTPAGTDCVRTEIASGHVTVAVDALPSSVAVVLDAVQTATVCAATASPGPVATPVITPPATDATRGAGPGSATPGLPLLIMMLASAVAIVAALAAGHRRSSRIRG